MINRIFTKELECYKLDSIKSRDILLDPPKKKKTSTLLENNKKHSLPIIIDYGSGITKAGWGNSINPDLVFRTVVAKTKDIKNIETPIYVGNKLKDIDYIKCNFRSPFEKNVIQHAGLLEHINDYIFNEIGVIDSEVKHPLLITECFANPEYCRVNIVEQFFECYGVPSILFGVDCLFSYYHNLNADLEKFQKNDSLLISIGNSTIHVVPIINGEVQFLDIKRINVGTANSFEIFQKNLVLKNNNHKSKFNLNNTQALFENFNCVALNFQDQLKYFKYGVDAFNNKSYINSIEYENNLIIQKELMGNFINPILIDISTYINVVETQNPEDNNKKIEMRKEQAQRLKEIMIKRKEEKKKQQLEEINELELIQKSQDQNSELVKTKLNFYGLETIDDAIKRIKKLKIKLGIITKETLEEEKITFLNIPDDQLTAEQLKQKRMQIIFKQAAETRAIKKEDQQRRREEIQKLKETDTDGYIKKLYERRKHILDKMEMIKKEKTEINTRNSRLNQKRMQTLAHLGSDVNLQKTKKGIEDTFGINDEDWNIYRGISRDYGSDEENFENKLNEIDIELREMDSNYIPIKSKEESSLYGLNSFDELIELSVERIKGPEVFFQPSLSGIDQSGLIDVILQVLKNYNLDIQQNLLNNIFLTGGGANVQNLKNRIEYDLKTSNPVGTTLNITIAKDPIFDTWKGMKLFSQKNNLNSYSITKREYEEKGAFYYKQNLFSNRVF